MEKSPRDHSKIALWARLSGPLLGLSLSKRLVETMGGAMGVESLVGRGSALREHLL